ncbi:hypothetical protein ACFLZK_00665 [Patescibacteria group bacterium]
MYILGYANQFYTKTLARTCALIAKKPLINPCGYENSEYEYGSEELTKGIPTSDGLVNLKELNTKY